MKSVSKFILYFVIVFTFLFLSSYKLIGVLSARHIATFSLLVYTFFNWKKRLITKLEIFYFVYLTIYLFCNLINGELLMPIFLTNIVTFHFSAIALILAMPILISDKKDLNVILSVIVVIFVLNSILTICQFYNMTWAWALGQFVNNGIAKELETHSELIERGDFIGRTITAGFTGFVVTNGYFTSTFLPICFERFHKSKIKNYLGIIFFTVLSGIVVYVNQERSSMVLVLLFFFYYFVFIRKVSNTIPVILTFLILAYFLSNSIQTVELGRFENLHDVGRASHFDQFFDWLSTEQALFGGFYNYTSSHEVNLHNSLLASWTMGGIFTFIAFSALFLYSIIELWRKARPKYAKCYGTTPVFLALSCLIYQIYSLTHSSGLQNDGIMFWIPYTLLIAYERIVRNERIIK